MFNSYKSNWPNREFLSQYNYGQKCFKNVPWHAIILATSVTPGPDNIGLGGESGNGRFYIGGSDKNGERGINSMTPCGDLFEKFNVNLNVEGISLKIIKFL